MNKSLIVLLYLACTGFTVFGQTQLDALALRYAKSSVEEFRDLLALPNDAHHPEDIEANVQWCETAFAKRGFTTKRLPTEYVPLLLAERRIARKDAKTVLIYLQIDGQPTDSTFWFQENPYQATLKEQRTGEGWVDIPWSSLQRTWDMDWRIFARSTSDAKGPVAMFLAAVDAMQEQGKLPDFHMKIIMDFEEEMGSPHLPAAVAEYREALAADMLVIFDGPMHVTNKPTLSFGARGIADVTLTVYGPRFPQHSGHYGNYVPNPALQLSQLLASMKDKDGRVTIPGYYDGISISEEVRQILRDVPDDEVAIRGKMGIAVADGVAPTLQESIQYPSLNVRGLRSGWVGEEVRTIIPSTAIAEIDVRLVKESDPQRLLDLIKKHIEQQGFYLIDHTPTDEERVKYPRICKFESNINYLAFRTEFDSEVGVWLTRALTNAFGNPPIRKRTSGGSIPISPFVTTLDIPAVTVPTVNPDNNQHSPNENIRLGNYVDGIKTIYAVLTEPLDKN